MSTIRGPSLVSRTSAEQLPPELLARTTTAADWIAARDETAGKSTGSGIGMKRFPCMRLKTQDTTPMSKTDDAAHDLEAAARVGSHRTISTKILRSRCGL
jgi:hypothetical protein